MKKDVFDFTDYKAYLLDYIKQLPGRGYGTRSKLAEELGCRVAYISQVLNSSANFSPEQGESLNRYLKHSVEESEYFHLLLNLERAGTSELRERISSQVERFRQKRLILKNRVDIKATLNPEDQAVYYSAWYFAAVHIIVTIEAYRTKDAIAEYLNLPKEKVTEVVDFLISVGLVRLEKGQLKPGTSRLFLGNDSPLIFKHHTNWRIRAIDSLDKGIKSDVHFSMVASLAREDVQKIKEKLVKDIQATRAIVTESKNEEELICFSLDFFKV